MLKTINRFQPDLTYSTISQRAIVLVLVLDVPLGVNSVGSHFHAKTISELITKSALDAPNLETTSIKSKNKENRVYRFWTA